jgi:hypothetical protein
MENFFKKVIEFLKSLLGDGDGNVSSKRVVGFGSFLLFIAFGIYHMITRFNVQGELVWATIALITGCFALNTAIDIKAITSKSDVASALAQNNTEDPAATKAQEIIKTEPSGKGQEEEVQG